MRYLTQVDHRNHEAIVAVEAIMGEGLGVARLVRSETQPSVAEAAVTVVDDWQGRGLGTLLLEVLAARAREEHITRFTALMLASNDEMMQLLERLGPSGSWTARRARSRLRPRFRGKGSRPSCAGCCGSPLARAPLCGRGGCGKTLRLIRPARGCFADLTWR